MSETSNTQKPIKMYPEESATKMEEWEEYAHHFYSAIAELSPKDKAMALKEVKSLIDNSYQNMIEQSEKDTLHWRDQYSIFSNTLNQ